MMTGMPDMRRRTPEPPAAAPEVQFKPGMASELLQELAPLLAEEGIDVNNIDVPDLDAALDWARKATAACKLPVEVRPMVDTAEG